MMLSASALGIWAKLCSFLVCSLLRAHVCESFSFTDLKLFVRLQQRENPSSK